MRRNLLFVDDQWCRPGDQATIRATFGALTRRDDPYIFHYETGELGPARYGIEAVLSRLELIKDVAAVILDVYFGEESRPLGLDILAAIRAKYPLLPVVIMTNAGRDLGILERAMELGATEYMVKTPPSEQLEEVLATYVEERGESSDYAIWGNSERVRKMRAEIARVAAADTLRVLVMGESGTGKELVARAIHRQGRRRAAPFVAKNCAYASTELLDSDLFGHERGAFTGASHSHVGLIEASNGGVLFLDEVSSMPVELQGKLLRVLETGTFERLGSRESRSSNFQLISATNKDPRQLISSGDLREDLFHRLAEYPISSPSLRERTGDIEILTDLFLKRARARRAVAGATEFPASRFSPAALAALRMYDWPGNVRQLRNVVSQASIRSHDEDIKLEDLPEELRSAKQSPGTPDARPGVAAIDSEEEHTWDPATLERERLRSEIEIALAVKEHVVTYKGKQWRAEFMRLLYPECRAQSAKGFQDLIRRLTNGPWGSSRAENDPELKRLLDQLQES